MVCTICLASGEVAIKISHGKRAMADGASCPARAMRSSFSRSTGLFKNFRMDLL